MAKKDVPFTFKVSAKDVKYSITDLEDQMAYAVAGRLPDYLGADEDDLIRLPEYKKLIKEVDFDAIVDEVLVLFCKDIQGNISELIGDFLADSDFSLGLTKAASTIAKDPALVKALERARDNGNLEMVRNLRQRADALGYRLVEK